MNEDEIDFRNLIFCPSCDYVTTKLDRDSLRCCPVAVMCSRCGVSSLATFYSYGSQTHIDRRTAWERGEVKGAPLALRKKAHMLKAVAFPNCCNMCSAIESLGVGECESVCPWKFETKNKEPKELIGKEPKP